MEYVGASLPASEVYWIEVFKITACHFQLPTTQRILELHTELGLPLENLVQKMLAGARSRCLFAADEALQLFHYGEKEKLDFVLEIAVQYQGFHYSSKFRKIKIYSRLYGNSKRSIFEVLQNM